MKFYQCHSWPFERLLYFSPPPVFLYLQSLSLFQSDSLLFIHIRNLYLITFICFQLFREEEDKIYHHIITWYFWFTIFFNRTSQLQSCRWSIDAQKIKRLFFLFSIKCCGTLPTSQYFRASISFKKIVLLS